jgi:pimeloyl-ACP methyl ester carboxylesterase
MGAVLLQREPVPFLPAFIIMRTRQVLFIQGGGAGTHDDWDAKLVESLEAGLGDAFEIRYPRMPGEDDASPPTWVPAIREELEALGPGAVVIGHSVGGTLLLAALVADPADSEPGAIVLLAAPFVGPGGWPGDLVLPDDLDSRLPPNVPVHLFHGLDDDTVPPRHSDLYADAIPGATVHLLPGRDHQLNDDLNEVAALIRSLPASTDPSAARTREDSG